MTLDDYTTINPRIPSRRPLPDDPYNTSYVADLPRPLNHTVRTNLGLFLFNHSAPLNNSHLTQVNGTYRHFTNGREFIFTPVDIEVNTIVQEFCEICPDRSDKDDSFLVTTVASFQARNPDAFRLLQSVTRQRLSCIAPAAPRP